MPMKSKGIGQVRVEMNEIFEKIKQNFWSAATNIELIDSIVEGADTDIASKGDGASLWYLGEAIKRMADAHIIFFVGDWQNYRGCRIERAAAEAYGKYCVDLK